MFIILQCGNSLFQNLCELCQFYKQDTNAGHIIVKHNLFVHAFPTKYVWIRYCSCSCIFQLCLVISKTVYKVFSLFQSLISPPIPYPQISDGLCTMFVQVVLETAIHAILHSLLLPSFAKTSKCTNQSAICKDDILKK